MKICKDCNILKKLEEFYKHPQLKDGRANRCKDCHKQLIRTLRQERKEYYSNYDKNRQKFSIDRILNHKYAGLRQRSEGRAIHKSTITGMDFLTRAEYTQWCETTKEEFMEIYKDWEESGFIRRLSPSIDRKDNKIGYVPSNMQWLTQSQNSQKYTKILQQ